MAELCTPLCVEGAGFGPQVDIPAERMIKPEDVAEAALLPFRLAARTALSTVCLLASSQQQQQQQLLCAPFPYFAAWWSISDILVFTAWLPCACYMSCPAVLYEESPGSDILVLPCRLSELACPTEIMIGNAMPIKSPHRR